MRASTAASDRTTRRTNVRENRARMAAALGVAPTHFVTCYQIHSPDVIVAEEPWTRENSPRADAIVTRVPGLAVGVGTADCGPVLFADARGRRGRRRACGLEGRAHRRARSDDRRDGETRRRARAHRGRDRPADPPAELRGRRRIRRSLHRGRRRERALLRSRRRAKATRMFDLPGYIKARLERADIQASRTSGCAPMRSRRASSATAVPPIAASRITAVTSMRLH